MVMLNPRDLEYFLAVAKHRSVSVAAGALFVSQPAISRRITELERHWGTKLFYRHRHGMQLTAAGNRLEGIAQDTLNRLRRTDEFMSGVATEDHQFTVVCPHSTADYFMAPLIAKGAQISDITSTLPQDVYGHLNLGVDIAVNTMPAPDHYQCREIMRMPIKAYFRPGTHSLLSDGSIELGSLTDFAIYVPGLGSAVEREVATASINSNLDVPFLIPSANGLTAQAHAAAGRGVAVATEPARFGLQSAPVHDQGSPLTIAFHAAWEVDHYAHQEIQKLVERFEHDLPGIWRELEYGPGSGVPGPGN